MYAFSEVTSGTRGGAILPSHILLLVTLPSNKWVRGDALCVYSMAQQIQNLQATLLITVVKLCKNEYRVCVCVCGHQ